MALTEWEGPIPVWIEAISIDMDEEMPMSDLMATSPSHPTIMNGNFTPVSTKMHSFFTCSTSADDQHSLFDTLLDDKPVVVGSGVMLDIQDVAVSPVKTKTPSAPPTISPAKCKPTAKPRDKVDVNPKKRRRDNQRVYEKNYRRRVKTKRSSDEVEWIQLETQVRTMLAKRTSVVVLGALNEHKTGLNPSTVCVRQRYLELLQEERALRESEALDSCILADDQAMTLWGGGTAPSREIREQLNGLPSLRKCHTFEFSW
ncbi:hypothetical protein PHYPSEUDO_007031 [Phytophthora pseudosyringae]|uniref:Uncharacterized protein n=1 Tax=Phytophthora pseudosyringae TaxID=221518 RepID=A0A8T1VHK3_9STRA|nr:hypothetical protein PHYPSEUDO_007031 [Phytophthora pseudosyringae]